jgi:hypothetical protein
MISPSYFVKVAAVSHDRVSWKTRWTHFGKKIILLSLPAVAGENLRRRLHRLVGPRLPSFHRRTPLADTSMTLANRALRVSGRLALMTYQAAMCR